MKWILSINDYWLPSGQEGPIFASFVHLPCILTTFLFPFSQSASLIFEESRDFCTNSIW